METMLNFFILRMTKTKMESFESIQAFWGCYLLRVLKLSKRFDWVFSGIEIPQNHLSNMHYEKYVTIMVFRTFYLYTVKYGSEKTIILAYFTDCTILRLEISFFLIE